MQENAATTAAPEVTLGKYKGLKAKKNVCPVTEEAIEADTDKIKHNKWRDIFGNDFPKYESEEKEALNINYSYRNTEEFIESYYPVDIRYDLKIDCEIKQNGYRVGLLRDFLFKNIRLMPNKS